MSEAPNPNAAPAKLSPTDRLCPFLSIAGAIAPDPSGARAPFTALPCQGIRCALFLPTQDAEGNVVGGGCALTALPMVLDAHAGQVGGVLKVLSSRAKIGLAPGIMG